MAQGKAGAPKGRRNHHPQQHQCTATCQHRCGEAGGRTKAGKPCTRPGGTGRNDVVRGSLNLCRVHDPRHLPPTMHGPQEATFPGLGLTALEAGFVIAYCGEANSNGTKAAELAGYGGPNATRASLQVTASVLLQKPKIRKAVLARWEALSAPSEEIMKRMTDDARLDISDLIQIVDVEYEETTPAGPVKKTRRVAKLNLTAENLVQYGPLIKEIETDPGTQAVVKVKLNDSQSARRDLARIRRLFSDSPIVNIFQLQEMPDDELLRRLEALRPQVVGGGRLGGREGIAPQPAAAPSAGNGNGAHG